MPKTQIYLEKRDYQPVRIQLPIYCQVQEENAVVLAKITNKSFSTITLFDDGSVTITNNPFTRQIALIWYNNQVTWREWQTAKQSVKQLIKEL
jgi:DNA phosphorothioation-dependent restriction protein DptG